MNTIYDKADITEAKPDWAMEKAMEIAWSAIERWPLESDAMHQERVVNLADVIAGALRAERERCAIVLDNWELVHNQEATMATSIGRSMELKATAEKFNVVAKQIRSTESN